MNLIDEVLDLDGRATKGPWQRQAEDSGIITGGIAYDGEPGVVVDTVPSDFSPGVGECFENANLITLYRTAAPKLARALDNTKKKLAVLERISPVATGAIVGEIIAAIEKELA